MATPFIAVAAALLLRSVYAKTTICHSHICNSPPSSVVTSILADVSQLATIHLTSEQDGLLEIDASFSRLDDESITSLVDGLLMQLHEQPADENTVKLHLRLSMNKLTPGGASKLFERLIADRVKSQDVDSSADTLAIQNVTVELTDIETDVSVNETISDEANTATNDQDEEEDVTPQNIELEKLDLSLNDIGGHGCNPANLAMLNSVRMMFEQGRRNVLVPRVLSLENCGAGPAFCRSIGRGILNAFENQRQSNQRGYRPSILHLGGNGDIGDPGAVSLAAALRLAISTTGSNDVKDDNQRVLDELDLSSCNIGDAGAESLALAIAYNPLCISKLDLSNNHISDVGASAIGRALVEAHRKMLICGTNNSCSLEAIILDNNVDIGDIGAGALADAMACGAVRCISLRSCSITSGGAAAFGKTVLSLATRKEIIYDANLFEIDLSGNTLGIRPVKKKKGFKDKASSHITSFGKTLQKGWKGSLKSAGVGMGLTAESDDDEEAVMGGLIDDDGDDQDSVKMYAAATRCGARAFAAEVLKMKDGNECLNQMIVRIGFRRCNLDDGAYDSLAAAVNRLKDLRGAHLAVDASLNTIEAETAAALRGDVKQVNVLNSMAQRHMEALAVLEEAQERAAMAAEAAAARANVEKQFGRLTHSDYDDQYDDY